MAGSKGTDSQPKGYRNVAVTAPKRLVRKRALSKETFARPHKIGRVIIQNRGFRYEGKAAPGEKGRGKDLVVND